MAHKHVFFLALFFAFQLLAGCEPLTTNMTMENGQGFLSHYTMSNDDTHLQILEGLNFARLHLAGPEPPSSGFEVSQRLARQSSKYTLQNRERQPSESNTLQDLGRQLLEEDTQKLGGKSSKFDTLQKQAGLPSKVHSLRKLEGKSSGIYTPLNLVGQSFDFDTSEKLKGQSSDVRSLQKLEYHQPSGLDAQCVMRGEPSGFDTLQKGGGQMSEVNALPKLEEQSSGVNTLQKLATRMLGPGGQSSNPNAPFTAMPNNNAQFTAMPNNQQSGGTFQKLKQRLGKFFGGGKQRKFAKECLKAHNKYRAKHGVPPLKLNKQVSLQWAQNLANSGSFYRSGSVYGENVFRSGGPVRGKTAVDLWYNEGQHYNFKTGTSTGVTAEFTQLVWKGTKELGVGFAQSAYGTFVVCNYSPPGNVPGLYQKNVLPPTRNFLKYAWYRIRS